VSTDIDQSNLKDPGLERSVLSGVLQHGIGLVLDVLEILGPKDFHYMSNQKIFAIVKYLIQEKGCTELDVPTILTGAKALGYDDLFDKRERSEYLAMLFESTPSPSNTMKMTVSLYTLSLARKAINCLTSTAKDLAQISGDEEIETIIAQIEEPIFEFTGKVISDGNDLKSMGENFAVAMKAVSENPQDIVGISTGFSRWDQLIGGGLRRGTVNVVCARPKVGKSMFCLNIARNVAFGGLPVLYLDTELTHEIQRDRLISLITKVKLDHIECGTFASIEAEKKAVWDAEQIITDLPITHCSIAGQSVQSIMSIARRWLSKYVGFNEFGKANPCLIIYDYLKLMSSADINNNMAEHQMLGFLMSSFHNFAVKWSLPILATVQLNREGVGKDGGEFIAASDRILWLCSNCSILKGKTPEEFAEDPPKNGTKKLIVTDTRFGPGMEEGNYINIYDHLEKAAFEEGLSFSEHVAKGFELNETEKS